MRIKCSVLLSSVALVLLTCGGPGTSGAQPAAGAKKSIRGWVSCSGVSDDAEGVVRAFAAAKHAAFTLVVDCPVRIHSGLDIGRIVHIDDGTTVEFTGSGKFTVDNVMHPAFVIANSRDITLTDWNVEYDATVPADPDVGGYANRGQFVSATGRTQPSGAWNDLTMTDWLAANKGIVFDRRDGNVRSLWVGTTNACAIFFMNGDTSNVTVTGMNVHAPATAGVERFIPVVFAFTRNYKSNQSVTAKTPRTAQFFAVPHNLTFSNITFDGTYMGFVGSGQNLVFEHIRSHRYGDLQDSDGGNGGGKGKWFAPPHLFYLAYDTNDDPAIFNRNIRIHDVVDDGPRVGLARDKGGTDTISGYAPSIKIGCLDCSVDTYKSTRPDGFLDLLYATRLTISNVDATYDSAFLNNQFPGWRFPSSGYSNVTFENIVLKDSAASSIQPPISNASLASNENIVFRNVRVTINAWSGKGPLLPNVAGQGNDVALDYTIIADASRIVSLQRGSMSQTLQATPFTLSAGNSTELKWTSKDASGCAASGAWSGTLPASGSRMVNVAGGGNHDYSITCQTVNGPSTTTLRVAVAQ